MRNRKLYLHPSSGLMDALERGESAISRIDSSLSRTQQAADRAKTISGTPVAKVVLAVGLVAAVGVGAYYLSKS